MLSFIRQNRNVLLVGLGVFMASMTALMFFLNQAPANPGELKADVMSTETSVTPMTPEEKSYREILNNTEDPVVVMGLDGTIQFNSVDFGQITGDPAEATKGKLFFALLKPEDMGIFMSAFGKAIQTGKPQTMIGPYRILNKSGDYSVNMGSVYPITENEKVTKIGLTTRDISRKIDNAESATQEDAAGTATNEADQKSVEQHKTDNAQKDTSGQESSVPEETINRQTESQPSSDVKAQDSIDTQTDSKQMQIGASTAPEEVLATEDKPVEQADPPADQTDKTVSAPEQTVETETPAVTADPAPVVSDPAVSDPKKDFKKDEHSDHKMDKPELQKNEKQENDKNPDAVTPPKTDKTEENTPKMEEQKKDKGQKNENGSHEDQNGKKDEHGFKWLKGDEIATLFWPWQAKLLLFPEHSLLARL